MSDVEMVMEDVRLELARAQRQHKPMHSAHEGYAVILEELEELKAEVFWGKSGTVSKARKEAVQVAAMAVRFVVDILGPGVSREKL